MNSGWLPKHTTDPFLLLPPSDYPELFCGGGDITTRGGASLMRGVGHYYIPDTASNALLHYLQVLSTEKDGEWSAALPPAAAMLTSMAQEIYRTAIVGKRGSGFRYSERSLSVDRHRIGANMLLEEYRYSQI